MLQLELYNCCERTSAPCSYDPVGAFFEERAELAGVVALEGTFDIVHGGVCGGFDEAVVDEGGDAGLFEGGLFCEDLCGAYAEDEHGCADSYGVY